MAVHVTVALVGVATLNLALPPPPEKHQEQPGRRQRRVPEVDQLVRIQPPSAEDGEGFLRNIRFKNVSVVEQF